MTDEEEWVPGNMSELLASIEHEWGLLWDVIAKLNETKMTTPDSGGWSPRDNIAHLSEWMNVLMGYHLDRRPAHEVLRLPEEATKDWDMEVINPLLFERNHNRTTQEVLDELKRVHGELLEKLNSLTYEYLLMPRHAEDPEKRPILMWVLGDSAHHFAEHRATIEKML